MLAGTSLTSSSSRRQQQQQQQQQQQHRPHRSVLVRPLATAANRPGVPAHHTCCSSTQQPLHLCWTPPPGAAAAAQPPQHSGHTHRARSTASWPTQHGRRSTAFAATSAGVDAEQQPLSDEQEYGDADSFYNILGLPLSASQRDIKRAYKALMKDFHPDLSGDEESTQFCILLNEIYDTLMDPERRATYDALAGFSTSSVNPFADTSLPADQVFVDEYTCIGCRNCTNVCPRTFEMEEDYGRARAMVQGVDSDEKLQEAIDTCPVSCIYWVTAPQLSLLEATMAKMERVAVWSLMSGGGSGADVFTEASIAWEKRRAAAAARVRAEADAASIWNAWFDGVAGGSAGANVYAQAAAASRRAAASASASASGSYDGAEEDEANDRAYANARGFEAGSKEGARIAQLAARAARASRQWKAWQGLQRRGRGLLLTATAAAAATASSSSSSGGE